MFRRFLSLVPKSKTNFLKKTAVVPAPTNPKYLGNFVPQSEQTGSIMVSQHQFKFGKESMVRTTVKRVSDEISPLNAIFIVDVSGSMGQSTGTNDQEMSKFSQLDLVRHQLVTVLTPLDEKSHVGVIVFNHDQSVLLPLCKLDDRTKTQLISDINNLRPSGGTSMAKPIETAINMFSKMKHLENPKIVVLSDGMANDTREVLDIPKSTESSHIQLSTFGYGYEIDYKMLSNLANQMSGQFSRVPDHSMGLTNYVNWLTHSLWDYGKVTTDKSSFQMISNVPYSFVTTFDKQPTYFSTPTEKITQQMFVQLEDNENENLISFNMILRQLIGLNIETALVNIGHKQLEHALNSMYDYISNLSYMTHDPFVRDILNNIKSGDPHSGQLLKALDQKYLYKWGEAYLYSIRSGLVLQRCLTFKDPILQVYGQSPQIIGLRNELEEIMTKVPIPPTSNSSTPYSGNASTFMSQTYQPSNPCVDGDMFTKLYDGTYTQLKFLKYGDKLENGAIVMCVIETKLGCLTQMVDLNGVLVTPCHPVQNYKNEWAFPYTLGDVKEYYVNSVFSFVLDGEHVMTVYNPELENTVNTITWGHRKVGDPVVEHNFFGNLILGELAKQQGWNKGYIQIKKYIPDFVFDKNGNKVISSFGKTIFE